MALLGMVFLVLLSNVRTSVALLRPVHADVQQEFGLELRKLLQRIHDEQPFEWIYLLREHALDCIDENLPSLFEVPTMIRNTEQPIYLKSHFNSELLALVCLRTARNLDFLDVLAKDMQHMRHKRVLVISNEDYKEPSSAQNLMNFFRRCMELKLLQVNFIHRDYKRTGIYHSYTQFPVFELEKQIMRSHDGTKFYSDRFKDMKGKIILTLPDQLEPCSMLFKDNAGKQQMTGYIGKLMRTFAAHYNCTLLFPYEIAEGDISYLSMMRLFTRNESIDVATSLSTAQRELNPHEYSYPVEIGKWMVMVPIACETPIYLRLLSLFNIEFLLTIIVLSWLLSVLLTIRIDNFEGISLPKLICNETVFRGMVGQAFRLQQRPKLALKSVYLLIFVAGFFVTVIFGTHLMRLFTAPPTIRPITTFDDLLDKNIKILIHKLEITNLVYYSGEQFWEKYQSIFSILHSSEDLRTQRMAFNTKYAFGITTSGWHIVAEQQKYFARKLYGIQPKLTFTGMLQFGLPLHENSIYKDPLNRLIMDLFASGIFDHWFSTTFYDMVELRRISFTDFSETRNVKSVQLEDFYLIWVVYVAGVGISCLVFLLELLSYYKCSDLSATDCN